MGKTNTWGIIGLLFALAFFASLGMAEEWYGEEERNNATLIDFRANNQIATQAGGVVVPPPTLDVLPLNAPDLGPDWSEIRIKRIQDAVNDALLRINFDFDKSDLDAEAMTAVATLTKILATNPEVHLKLSGHTDLMGSEEYNMGLSQRRAEAVRQALMDSGIDGSRLIVAYFGKANPLINIMRKERANRRVEAEAFAVVSKQF